MLPLPSGRDLVWCRSFADYCFLCASPSINRFLVPVLEGPDSRLAARPGEPFRTESFPPAARKEFGERWESLDWRERCGKILSAAHPGSDLLQRLDPAERGASIVAGDDASAICCALLAGYLGLSLRVESDLLAAVRDELASGRGPVIVAAPLQEAGDSLLLALLTDLEAELAAEVPWVELPRLTLLTGRNLAAFSWMVAKTILASFHGGPPSFPVRVAHFQAGESASQAAELLFPENGAPRLVPRRQLAAAELIDSLTASADVIAYQTHGMDACAKGGAGVVLCGLHSEGLEVGPESSGVLACGRGHPCPRGPHPLPLSQIPTRILMLGTCNGLRLGDSVLDSAFNLGLRFLDGEGLAYVGSLLGAMGNDLATAAFLAALASGRTLVEATTLVNGSLSCAGVERAVYLAVGMPGLRLSACPQPVSYEIHPDARGLHPLDIDAGTGNLAELVTDDPLWVMLARERRLGFSVSSHLSEPRIYWFYRVERARAGGVALRIFVFRFPESLGMLQLVPCDVFCLKRKVLDGIDALARWLELGRIAGLAHESDDYLQLGAAEVHAREALARGCLRLAFDGSAFREVREHLDLVDSLVRAARALALENFLPLLAGPFWLPNIFSREYGYDGGVETACPNCGGDAIRKTLRHPLHGAARRVDVCPRCGIVRDIREGCAFEIASVEAPAVAEVGGRMDVFVAVRSHADRRVTVEVCPRLSTLGRQEVLPELERAEAVLEGQADVVLGFHFRIPADLPPHQYYLKILAASGEDLAFASRMIFFR